MLKPADLFKHHHVLAVGVPQYDNHDELPYAAVDAEDVAAAFRSVGYRSGQVVCVPPAETTYEDLRGYLNQFHSAIREPGQHGVLFWVGHGWSWDPDRPGVLIARDTGHAPRRNRDRRGQDAFTVGSLLSKLGKSEDFESASPSGPETLTAFFDACHSRSGRESADFLGGVMHRESSQYVLGFEGKAYGDPSLGRKRHGTAAAGEGSGLVAHFLLTALDSDKCSSKGHPVVHADRLVEWVRHQIAERLYSQGSQSTVWAYFPTEHRNPPPIGVDRAFLGSQRIATMSTAAQPFLTAMLQHIKPNFSPDEAQGALDTELVGSAESRGDAT